MLFLKAVPVASFVILVLIWAGSRNLSVVISFLVVLPVIYVNTLAGLQSTDPKLLEMAVVFRMPVWRKIRFIYLPALVPYLVIILVSAVFEQIVLFLISRLCPQRGEVTHETADL